MSEPRDEDVDPRYSAVFQRGYDPERDGLPDPEPDSASTGSEIEAPPDREPALDSGAREDPESHSAPVARSPRALTIGTAVLSAVLLVVGIGLVFVRPGGATSPIDFPELLAEGLSPALVLGGGIGLALAALLAAIRVRRDD